MARRLAVVGRPILHSHSPQLFAAAFAHVRGESRGAARAADETVANPRHEDRSVYTRLSSRSAEQALQLVRQLELDGLNVTSPFKDGVARRVDTLDETAAAVGAVNTVIHSPDGLRGCNTDPAGVVAALGEQGVSIRGRRVAVIGTGGAGRAAAWAMVRARAKQVALISRAAKRADEAARPLGVEGCGPEHAGARIGGADVVISCAPQGILALDPALLHTDQIVMDANYTASPLTTAAERVGCTVVPGSSWLLHQAARAFELLTERPAPLQAMRHALRDKSARQVADKPNIALVGFSGAGKSTLAELVAQRLGMACIDTDRRCEQRAGKTISELFAQDGERAFRAIERAVLEGAIRGRHTVVACGGGALLDPAIRTAVRHSSLVIWLWAPLEVCLARTRGTHRPLLAPAAAPALAARLLRERQPSYAEAADLILSVEDLTPEQSADELCHEIRTASDGHH